MAHAENQITIHKPISEVYEFVADGLNNPKWRAAVISIQLAGGNAGEVGAEYAQTLKGPGGRQIQGDYRITKAESNKEINFVVIAGPARPEGRYLFEALPDGTKVSFSLDLQPKGLMKFMNGMITKTMEAEVGNLATLKQVLESS